jgi:hypothetical protein
MSLSLLSKCVDILRLVLNTGRISCADTNPIKMGDHYKPRIQTYEEHDSQADVVVSAPGWVTDTQTPTHGSVLSVVAVTVTEE